MEETPNPRTMKFVAEGRDILGPGRRSQSFKGAYDAAESPMALALFAVAGVQEVTLTAGHVNVMKAPLADWEDLEPEVKVAICEFLASGRDIITPSLAAELEPHTFEPS